MHKSILAILLLVFTSAGSNVGAADVPPASAPVLVTLWPGTPPDAQPAPGPQTDWSNIVRPSMTVHSPQGRNTGFAIIVFPGGGFEGLAIKGEGTDVCDWLTSRGITCVLLRYRVPSLPYDWHCKCRPDNLTTPTLALEDAQRAMSLLRYRAADWHVDPHKIGVLGFSAGGYLVAEISTRYAKRLYPPRDAADEVSSRPDFAVGLYPGHLWNGGKSFELNPNAPVNHMTPPTFLVQAEDDTVDSVNNSIAYYVALKDAGVPAELHLYAHGGHAFGLRQTDLPIGRWPALAEQWLHTVGMQPQAVAAPECAIGGADALARCLDLAEKVEDQHLNATYELTMRMLDEAVDPERAFFADKKASLIAAERTWIKFRDAQCTAEVDLRGTGGSASLTVQVSGDCYLRMTRERIAYLREIASLVAPDSKLCAENAAACQLAPVPGQR